MFSKVSAMALVVGLPDFRWHSATCEENVQRYEFSNEAVEPTSSFGCSMSRGEGYERRQRELMIGEP